MPNDKAPFTDQIKLLKAKEVAEILNIGLSTVYQLANAGQLPFITIPHCKKSQATKRNWSSKRFLFTGVLNFCKLNASSGSGSKVL